MASGKELSPFDKIPLEAVEFPKRCAQLCVETAQEKCKEAETALDLGCAVGRSTFELTKYFKKVTVQ